MSDQLEILPPESRASIALTIPNAEALPPSMLTNIQEGFQDAFAQAESWREKALAIKVMMGRAIDGVNNLLLAAIQPLERHLEEQEKFAERLAEQERQRRLSEAFAKWIEDQISTL